MSNLSYEQDILDLFENDHIGPYMASWILNKKFNKGYKSISNYLSVEKTITNDIKNLSSTMYKSKVFSQKIIVLLTTKFDSINETIIKKLVAVSNSIYLVETVDVRETEFGDEIFVKYKSGHEDILSDVKKRIVLPDFESTVFKLILKSTNGMEEVLKKVDDKFLEQINDGFLSNEKETPTENHIDDILSAFDFK